MQHETNINAPIMLLSCWIQGLGKSINVESSYLDPGSSNEIMKLEGCNDLFFVGSNLWNKDKRKCLLRITCIATSTCKYELTYNLKPSSACSYL